MKRIVWASALVLGFLALWELGVRAGFVHVSWLAFIKNRPRYTFDVICGLAGLVGLWLAVSFGFRIYLGYFDSYSVTYGSLGALIVLMLWFYLTGVAILIGGEVNCEFQQECEREP